MQPVVTIALRAVRQAAEQITRAGERLAVLNPEQKSPAEFIRELNQQVENTIARVLQKAYPHHSLHGNFTGEHKAQGEGPNPCHWQITAIDNTSLFAKGIPSFALVLSGYHRDRLEHALVINPLSGEEFTASRGEGAQFNDKRLRVSRPQHLDGTTIGTGFMGDGRDDSRASRQQEIYGALLQSNATPYTTGSVALDLAYVAAGRLDGCYHLNINAAQFDAGILIAKEAGALVGDSAGGNNYASGDLVCANPKLFKSLLTRLHHSA